MVTLHEDCGQTENFVGLFFGKSPKLRPQTPLDKTGFAVYTESMEIIMHKKERSCKYSALFCDCIDRREA